MSGRLRSDSGVALVTAMLMIMVMIALIVLVSSVTIHTNTQTTRDRLSENAFHAANAGIDHALDCLVTLPSSSGLSSCSAAASTGTILTDAGSQVGQFGYTVVDITPPGVTAYKLADIVSTGYGPTQASARVTRKVEAEVRLVPVGGFFDTLFAGGSGGAGQLVIKNNAIVNGSSYAATYDNQKNSATFGDLRSPGDLVGENNDTYHSLWAGGSLTLGENSVSQTFGKACGAGTSPGNASLGNGSLITTNLTYKGTLSGGGSAGSYTHSSCTAPATVTMPAYSFVSGNYPGWSIAPNTSGFTTPALANACLATANSTTLVQADSCGGVSLGDADGTLGKSATAAGTVVYVNVPSAACSTIDLTANVQFAGRFTVISTCALRVSGTWTKYGPASGTPQVVMISTRNSGAGGADDLTTGTLTTAGSITVLLFSPGNVVGDNNVSISAGSIYGGSVTMKNNLSITGSPALGTDPPPGFTFDPSLAATYTPVVQIWREKN